VNYGRKFGIERLPVARKQINVAILFDRDRAVAIQLQLVLPKFAFWNLIHFLAFHWRNETQWGRHFLHLF